MSSTSADSSLALGVPSDLTRSLVRASIAAFTQATNSCKLVASSVPHAAHPGQSRSAPGASERHLRLPASSIHARHALWIMCSITQQNVKRRQKQSEEKEHVERAAQSQLWIIDFAREGCFQGPNGSCSPRSSSRLKR